MPTDSSSSRLGHDGIPCFAPGCRAESVALGRDKMVGCTVAFCENHADEWLAKGNIEEKYSP